MMQYMYLQHYLGLGRAARGWSASNLPSRTLPRPAPCIKTRERAQDGARLTTSASARGRATAAAPFAGRTADQVSGFLRDGFTTIKASRVRGDGLEELAATVGAEAAAVLTSKEDTWRYALWRVFNSVQDNQKRHSLPLPMSPSLRRILNAAVGQCVPRTQTLGTHADTWAPVRTGAYRRVPARIYHLRGAQRWGAAWSAGGMLADCARPTPHPHPHPLLPPLPVSVSLRGSLRQALRPLS